MRRGSAPPHVIRTVADRSGGNPQFLLDLLRSASESGVEGLPDTVESAAMAEIDRLAGRSDHRAASRRVRGGVQSAHARWVLDDDAEVPGPDVWERLDGLLLDDGDGHLRFRRALMRDAAYEGLPHRLRRRLHARIVEEIERASAPRGRPGGHPGGALRARRGPRPHLAVRPHRRGPGAAAPADAASHYRRALGAARGCGDVGDHDVSEVTEALGEALIRAGELEAAVDAFRAAGHLRHDDPVSTARLLLRQAYVAERVGSFDRMLRLTRKASRTLEGRGGWAPMRLRGREGLRGVRAAVPGQA